MIDILNRLKYVLSLDIKLMLYNYLILPHINYCMVDWGYKGVRLLKTSWLPCFARPPSRPPLLFSLPSLSSSLPPCLPPVRPSLFPSSDYPAEIATRLRPEYLCNRSG